MFPILTDQAGPSSGFAVRFEIGKPPSPTPSLVEAFANPTHPAGNGPLVIPPSRRTLAEIQEDDRLSNGARRLAAYLDGRCLAFGKWAAWPKVSTIAAELGWGGDPRAFRKRVGRYFRELIESGDVSRPRLGDLVAWYDAEGCREGFEWPKGLRRGLCRSSVVTLLGWKLAEAEATKLPSLTPCDISVASNAPTAGLLAPGNVACHPPEMSHAAPPEMSHLQNVRSLNGPTEPTLNAVALALEGEGEALATIEPTATGEVSAAVEAIAVIPSPAAPLPPVVEPPPALSAEEVADQVAKVRSKQPDFLRKLAYWALEESGNLPADLVGTFPPRQPETESERRGVARIAALATGPPAGQPPAKAAASPIQGTPPASKPAPRVPAEVQADVRRRLARLHLPETTNPDVLATARALADALGPHQDKGKTEATFLKWCGQARSGVTPQSVLTGAFDDACRFKKAESRGAFFVSRAKELWAEAKGRGRSPSPG